MPSDLSSKVRPIGVFDSGIGGLTVVKALRDLLPWESIVYVGDTARVPYGSKSPATVERYSVEIADVLMKHNAKAVVVACNTASSVALPRLEQFCDVPVIGVIRPGAEAAMAATRNGRIGVIGTRATIKSGAYERSLRELDPAVSPISRACPLLVPLIEEGWLNDAATDVIISRYLEPLVTEEIDTLVLGCTHYPLLTDAFRRALKDHVALVDSARNCAIAVRNLLGDQKDAGAGALRVALTDSPDNFLRVAKEALSLDIEEPELWEIPPQPRAAS